MKILIAGDLVVSQSYSKDKIDERLAAFFSQADYRIVNLEAPVSDSNERITKVGPHLHGNKKSTANILKHLNINCVTLANNHIRDLGDQGVKDTLEFCKENNIVPVGAGRNLAEASRTEFIDSEAGTIALVNIAENEWCNATEWTAGANPMDLIDNANQIQKARGSADWVFVIIHGGHEYYNLPSPRMQKQYRFYAEQGADLVVAHHTHCINGYEIHQGVPIYYSLGNFLFTKKNIHDDWYKGLVLEVELEQDKLMHRLHPVEVSELDYSLSLNLGAAKDIILQRVDKYHKIIIDKQELQLAWKSYVIEKTPAFLMTWSVLNFIPWRYVRGGLRRLGFSLNSRFGLVRCLNFIRCEAHRDLSCAVLRRELNTPDPDFKQE